MLTAKITFLLPHSQVFSGLLIFLVYVFEWYIRISLDALHNLNKNFYSMRNFHRDILIFEKLQAKLFH